MSLPCYCMARRDAVHHDPDLTCEMQLRRCRTTFSNGHTISARRDSNSRRRETNSPAAHRQAS